MAKNTEIITPTAKGVVRSFLQDKYGCHFTEKYYNGLDNKIYGDYGYQHGDLLFNVDFKHSWYNSGLVSLELTDYKKETWLLNNNIHYLCFETPKEVVILRKRAMLHFAKQCIIADYGSGRDFFATSTHLKYNKDFKGLAIQNLKHFRPMFVPEKYKSLIKEYVECHCSKKQGCIASVKISFLKMCDLIEFYYLK